VEAFTVSREDEIIPGVSLTEAKAIVSGQAEKELDEKRAAINIALAQRRTDRSEKRLARTAVAAAIDHAPGVLPTVAALSDHERRRYSVANLISHMAKAYEQNRANPLVKACEPSLESEISDSIANDLKMIGPHGGHWVPLSLQASGLDTKRESVGGYLTTNKVMDIVDALRAHTRVLQLGATLLPALRFNAQFPIEDQTMVAAWCDQNGGADVSESQLGFKAGVLSPKTLQCTTSASRQLLQQSNLAIENWIRDRIARANALALDRGCIHGSGVSNEPTGILNLSSIGSVTIGQNGGAPTSDAVIALESAVAGANGDSGSMGFLTNSVLRSRLRKVVEITGGVQPIWRDGKMLDYNAVVSNQVRSDLSKGSSNDCSPLIFGAWNQLLIGEFSGAIELLADPFALKRRGMIELSSWAAFDVLLIQPTAMAACLDMRNV
jgi:HK97 family phage major capsid protein